MMIDTRRSAVQKRAVNEKFRRRYQSLSGKGNDLKKYCGAEVYMVVYYNCKHYVYTSTKNPSWPPAPQQIVSGLSAVCRSIMAELPSQENS